MFHPGDVVAGKYRVERVLGEGGMGVVVLAEHTELEQRVALKFMRQVVLPPDAVNRFQREARAVAKLRGENVARVIDVGILDDGTHFIVMEYLEGRDLASLTKERALPLSDAVDFVLQAALGLAEAHAQGIVHRDLKPANLFLTSRPDGSPLIKVLDFGVSKLRQEDDPSAPSTQTGAVVGSPLYMPPEQARSSKDVDLRADIWALGAVLYQLVAQRAPFKADNFADLFVKILNEKHAPLSAVSAGVPPSIDPVIDRCLAKNPADRYATLGDLAAALAPFASPDGARLTPRIQRLAGDSRASSAAEVDIQVTVDLGHAATAVSAGAGASTQNALAVSTTSRPSRGRLALLVAGGALVLLAAFGLLLSRSSTHTSGAGEPVHSAPRPDVSSTAGSAPTGSASAPGVAPSVPVATPVESAAPRAETSGRAAKPSKSAPGRAPRPSASSAPAATPAKTADPFGTMQ